MSKYPTSLSVFTDKYGVRWWRDERDGSSNLEITDTDGDGVLRTAGWVDLPSKSMRDVVLFVCWYGIPRAVETVNGDVRETPLVARSDADRNRVFEAAQVMLSDSLPGDEHGTDVAEQA